jgi:hypothetical protein
VETRLHFDILPQPDDTACGPTCLHAVYGYYGDELPLEQVIRESPQLEEGGTLAVLLGCHALRRGFRATIYTYNLQVFDPTWFAGEVDLAARLETQAKVKRDSKLRVATRSYLEFIRLGGRLEYEELRSDLLRRLLKRGTPILTGLSATYLYGCAREADESYDDVRGVPMGHFVVLSGYDAETRRIMVADPLRENPAYESQYYDVGIERLIGAIFLGILTYDANLLVITPPPGRQPWPSS